MFKITLPKWFERIQVQFKKNPHLAYGLPFMTAILLGPFLMTHFGRVRYKYRKVKEASVQDLEELGIKVKRSTEEITLESEYEKMKEMDIDSWEQVRGPRPWEENFETDDKEAN